MRRSRFKVFTQFFIGFISVVLLSHPILVVRSAPVPLMPDTTIDAPKVEAPAPVLPVPVLPKPIEIKPIAPKPIAPRPIAPKPIAPKPTSIKSERRGVWLTNIDSDVLFKPDKLTAAVNTLAELNFNALYPVVWNFGYTFYPSKVAQAASGFKQAPGLDRDMLAELIPQAHAKNLLVMPWFEFGFMAPETSDLALNHVDWLTTERNGNAMWSEGGEPRVWLNPFLPAVQSFMIDLVMETVNGYDVDGIQFDDHFGLPNTFGYDEYTIALYRQEHAGKAPPVNAEDTEWTQWRANKITDFTTRLVKTIKAKKPTILFSLSPNPYDFAYQHSLQDWRTWQQKGLLDELIIQVYVSSIESFQSHLRRPEVQAAAKQIPVSIGVLSGLKGKRVPFNRIEEQVTAVRRSGLSGVSFFFYETLWNIGYEGKSDRLTAFRRLFQNP